MVDCIYRKLIPELWAHLKYRKITHKFRLFVSNNLFSNLENELKHKNKIIEKLEKEKDNAVQEHGRWLMNESNSKYVH